MSKLKPCDCLDMASAANLNEQGIGINDNGITVEPGTVVLRMGHTTVRIPMSQFRAFAEWYLEPQDIGDRYYTRRDVGGSTTSKG